MRECVEIIRTASSGKRFDYDGQLYTAQGYGFCFAAENIAKGQTSLKEVMQSWANSSGHRKNMAHRKVTEFALARANGNIWVMVLGTPGC